MKPNAKPSKIDSPLRRLIEIRPFGQTYSPKEIADFCHCDKELIRQIELAALRKIRRRLPADVAQQLLQSLYATGQKA